VSSTTIERVETRRTVLVRMRIEDVADMQRLLRDPCVVKAMYPEVGIPTEQDVIDGTAAKEVYRGFLSVLYRLCGSNRRTH
jgi:hypothetical protein